MNKVTDFNTISTKKGDYGKTRNYSNDLFPKSNILFDVLGEIDELSSSLGIAYHYSDFKNLIKHIQQDLQNIMSLVATRENDERQSKLHMITNSDIIWIETEEQKLLDNHPLEPKFVLPGSDTSLSGAYLDLARAKTRSCERLMIKYIFKEGRKNLEYSLKYLNRLSDLLFIIARNS
jgi:cob(I)alamin adenosyltransferase